MTKILFQGDSITDCGRNRNDPADCGPGYPGKVKGYLDLFFPGMFEVVNRGISGNRTVDLAARWKEDCLDIKPDVLSILIGINDTWRRYDRNLVTTAEEFEKNYRYLLTSVRQALPDTKILLMVPFLLPVVDEREKWRVDLDPKKNIVKKLAVEYGTDLIALDGLLARMCTREAPAYWAADGVHPTDAGHGIIARKWLESRGLLCV